ncbi:MAG: hypothetical protein KAJ92_02370 [Gammaproteobacteria bacterium]|nr:hypothetical protein [Gammaproteobacteria bacterium]
MLEYVLFHEKTFLLFVDWLKSKGVSPDVEIGDDTYEIKIPEDLDDELLDAVDEKYEALMDMSQQMTDDEEKENQQGYHMAGIVVTLKDGTVSYADVDPKLLGRVMSAISPEELGVIVSAIADAVEKPQPKAYCQRVREGS